MDRQHLFISNFKENSIFLGKVLLFIFLVFLFFSYIEPEYMGSYNSALIDKVSRLETINEPKIVLLGNSNLVFGIDSALIEEEIGMPVVNMGLHGGLGNAFHEEMAKYNIHKGDIYIICHSNYSDNDEILNTELAWLTIENHFKLWRIIRFKDWPRMIEAFPAYLRKTIDLHSSKGGNVDAGGAYSRSAFNEYGDCGMQRESVYTKMDTVDAPGVCETTVKRINRLNKYLKERGATLLIAGYPIGNGEVTVEEEKFIEFQRKLTEQVECPVISDFTDYMYDYSYFYDNHAHLNSEGARIRTIQLISDLMEWIG